MTATPRVAGDATATTAPVPDAQAPSLEAALARHDAFWRCESVDRPLLGMSRWSQVTTRQFDWGLPADEGLLGPGMLDVTRFLPQYESLFGGRPLDDDLCWPAMPPTAIPWLEAMLGCPVRYSLASGSMWAEPIPDLDLQRAPPPAHLDRDPWLAKLLEFVEALAALSGGRFAIGLPLMRGPWDLVAAALGTEGLYLGLYDRPAELAAFATGFADVWDAVARRLAAAIPAWRGGHVAFLGLWSPAFPPMAQDDASVSVSAGLYRRFMGPVDARITARSDRGIFHLHSAGLHVLDDVLDLLRPGTALNVDLDPAGPPLDQILPALRRVQARAVPLHLLSFDRGEALAVADRLSPAGLAVTYQPLDPVAEREAHPEGLR